MKKLFALLIAAVTIAFVVPAETKAQVSSPVKTTKVSADTTADAATVYVTLTAAPDNLVSISAVVTKVSGTVAGTVILQGTADGTNWVTIDGDTLTLANQTTNVIVWTVTHNSFYSYRIKHTGSGTQRSIPSLVYVRRIDH